MAKEDPIKIIVRSIGDGVIATDQGNRVLFANRAAEDIFGFKESEALGREISELVKDDNIVDLFRKVCSGEESSIIVETGMRHPQAKALSVTVTPLPGKRKTIGGVVAIFRDQTQKRSFDEDMQREDKLATLGYLSSWVAHEVRNPLNSITIHLELLKEDLRDEAGKESLHLIDVLRREISRLDDTVQEFLHLDKLPALRIEEDKVERVLNELVRFIRSEASEKDVKIHKEYQKDLPAIPLDRKQLRQALLNIMVNSMQAMPEGGELRLRLRMEGNYIVIEIEDTGAGIVRKDMRKIFDFFYSTKEGGSGLGLSIANKIVRDHGGRIKIDSEVERGTKVTILLPLQK